MAIFNLLSSILFLCASVAGLGSVSDNATVLDKSMMPFNLRLRLSPKWIPPLILAAVALPYFINLGTSSLWDASESFYAETAREMLENEDYLAPRFNYQPRPQKPPLTYWVVLVSYKVFGVSEFAVRLPGALAALGVLLFTYALGRLMFSQAAGILATVVLGTTVRFFVLARKLPIDILLLFWLLGTAYFLARALRRKHGEAWSWALVYLFVALGFLTKGPIALLIPAASYGLWALWAGTSSFRATRPVIGILIFSVVVAPWYVLIYISHGWTYIASFFLRDNLGRFATETFGPARGPSFYLTTYAADFFPWSILSVGAIYYLWRGRKTLRADALEFGFPLVWCGVIFLLFSLSKNKQEYYIAPLYPMMSVLLAGILDRTLLSGLRTPSERLAPPWLWSFSGVSLALFSLSIFLPALLRSMLPELPALLHYLPSALLMLLSFSLTWHAVREKRRECLVSLTVPLWLLFFLAAAVYIPFIESLRPVKEMCKLIRAEARSGDEAGYYLATVPSMVFYLHRPIFEEFDRDEMVRRFESSKTVYCILTENDYNYFVGSRDLILYVLDRRPRLITQLRLLVDEEVWAGHELVLVSNRPSSESGRESP